MGNTVGVRVPPIAPRLSLASRADESLSFFAGTPRDRFVPAAASSLRTGCSEPSLLSHDDNMGKLISDYVTEALYQRFARDKAAPPLSRHAILHGFDTMYANEMDSVRAILIVIASKI